MMSKTANRFTHEVMGTLRPVDDYMAELMTALKKAFKVSQNLTQAEALRQKRRYDQSLNSYTEFRGCHTGQERPGCWEEKNKRPLE